MSGMACDRCHCTRVVQLWTLCPLKMCMLGESFHNTEYPLVGCPHSRLKAPLNIGPSTNKDIIFN